ncbi:MAG: hypothetical protein KAR83_01025, partial [Thermodesulfovibrionales bacterium]|nr:hypothetical protein [Thermodesulfovibrionales bacterium]
RNQLLEVPFCLMGTLNYYYCIATRLILLCALCVAISLTVPAHCLAEGQVEEQGEEQEDGTSRPWWLIEPLIEPIREELLSIELPDTERRHHIGISMNPKVVDIVQKDYISMPVKFRYGLTKNIELAVMPGTYIHNPKRKTAGLGVANMDLGFKYKFLHILRQHVSMAFAFNTLYPVGSNPGLMDGYVHYKPKLIVSKTLEDFHKVEVVSSIGWDIIDGASEPLEEEDEDKRNTTALSLGFKLPRATYAWSMGFVYTTDKPDGGDHEGFTATPGWHWYVPREQARWFPGDITLGLGVSFGIMDARSVEYITKVNASIPLKFNVDLKKRELEFESEELSEAFQKLRERMSREDPAGEAEGMQQEGVGDGGPRAPLID